MNKSAAMRAAQLLPQAAGWMLILLAIGCDPTPAPTTPPPAQNTNVAGQWLVNCAELDDDCQSFTITFAPNGDISDLNGQGVSQGMGQINKGQLFFYVNDTFTFTGNLDALGNVATGKATDLTIDESIAATATRKT